MTGSCVRSSLDKNLLCSHATGCADTALGGDGCEEVLIRFTPFDLETSVDLEVGGCVAALSSSVLRLFEEVFDVRVGEEFGARIEADVCEVSVPERCF
jgi:hypothetical protein